MDFATKLARSILTYPSWIGRCLAVKYMHQKVWKRYCFAQSVSEMYNAIEFFHCKMILGDDLYVELNFLEVVSLLRNIDRNHQ